MQPENFIDNFLKEAAYKLAQQLQQQPAAKQPIDPAQLQSSALKLVQNLRQLYSPVSIAGTGNEIYQKNLFSINSLLLWLATNKTRVNGHRVAYFNPPPVQPSSPAEQKGKPVGATIEKDPNDEEIKYVGALGQTQVWRDGLVEFLKELRKNAADSGNLYFQELVGKLIDDANTNPAFDAGLDSEEKPKEKPVETPADKATEQKQELKPLPKDPNAPQGQPSKNPNVQQVSDKEADPNVQKSLEQSGGEPSLVFPFELDSDMISIALFRRFLMQTSALLENPTFNAANQNWISVLNANINATDTQLRNYQQIATDTTAAEGGFSLSVNTSVDQFVDGFADVDYGKARNLLLALGPICTKLSYILNVLARSPVKLSDDPEMFREQIQRGQDYVNRINSWVTQINNIAGRR